MRFLFSFLLLVFSFTCHAALKVTIDPGHGGFDRGAVYGSAAESRIVLQVALELQKVLKNKYGFEVHLTRSQDQHLSLGQRVRAAETTEADLFISLHANAATDTRARGFEFFIQQPWTEIENAGAVNTDSSKKEEVREILTDLGQQQRFLSSLKISRILSDTLSGRIKQGPFRVISKTSMPAVLIELGFLSHPDESQKLQNPSFQKTVAEKMADSIKQFCRASQNNYATVRPCEMTGDKKIN